MKETDDFREDKNFEVKKGDASPLWKRTAIFAAALLVAFLLGLIPMWLSKNETVRQRDAAQSNLRLSQLQNRLGTAAINARHGDYEPARVATSDFYTDLRAEVDRSKSALTGQQIESVRPILQERDGIITLLARRDPAAADRLSNLYLTYYQAMNPPEQKLQ